MKKYEGKRVVITGGTSGIGLTTAELLLAEGARVLVTGHTQATLDAAREALGEGAIVRRVRRIGKVDVEIDPLSAAGFELVDELALEAARPRPIPYLPERCFINCDDDDVAARAVLMK